MRFIPFERCVISTKKTRKDVLRILDANIRAGKVKDQNTRVANRLYIGEMSGDTFRISPRSPSGQRASLLMKGRVYEEGRHVNIDLRFSWTALDYLLNGTILACFAGMSFFCFRHIFYRGHYHLVDLLPVLAFVLAYTILMMVFNISVDHRKREFERLFENPYYQD